MEVASHNLLLTIGCCVGAGDVGVHYEESDWWGELAAGMGPGELLLSGALSSPCVLQQLTRVPLSPLSSSAVLGAMLVADC